MKKECDYCKKEFWIPSSKQRFCSWNCYQDYQHKIANFYNSKSQSKRGKMAAIVNKNNNTGLYNSKIKQLGGIISAKKDKRLKRKFYNLNFQKNCQKKAYKINKKNKTSACFDKSLQIQGGLASIKILRKQRKIEKYNNVLLDSSGEKEIAMNLRHQFKINFKEGQNIHITIGEKEYDFFVNNSFLEWHPIYNTKREDYYSTRRKNLNKFGYKNNPLIILP